MSVARYVLKSLLSVCIFSLAIIYWFRGSISGIALGSGAIVFGIVIDYSFHFFSHQKHNKDNNENNNKHKTNRSKKNK